MRKALAVSVVVLLAVLFAIVPAQAAPHSKGGVLRLNYVLHWTEDPGYWWGTVTGDIEGMIWFRGYEYIWTGNAVHARELWTICVGEVEDPHGCLNPESGSYIAGNDLAVVGAWKKPFWNANGWVTGASSDFADLVGYKYHETGWMSWSVVDGSSVGYCEMTAFLAPAS